MIYEYECPSCNRNEDVIKSVKEIDRVETCPDCERPMLRLFRPCIHTSFGTFKEGYYHAFGKHFTTKNQLHNELTKHRLDTGKQLVEVGNEKIVPPVAKQKPDMGGAVRELKGRLHG